MRPTLFKHLFLSVTAALLLLIIIGFGSITKVETDRIEKMLIAENIRLVEIASTNIETGYATSIWPLEMLRGIAKSPGILFWWIIDWQDKIRLASDTEMWGKKVEPLLSDEQGLIIKDYPEYKGDQTAKIVVNSLNILHLGKRWKFVLCFSEKPILEARRRILINNLALGGISVFIALLLSFYISRRITKPVAELIEGTRKIGKGNLSYRIKLKSRDEFGSLANSFNKMTEDLKKSKEEIEEYSKTLEKKVEERTKELQVKVKELEDFHDVAVGQELEMIRLEERIKELEAQLKKVDNMNKKLVSL